MLPVLLDQNFDYDIVQGLLRRWPELHYVTAHEAGVSDWPDPKLLIWAANQGLLLLTHDLRTMPGHIADVIATGHTISGVVIVPRSMPLLQAIDELELIITCGNKDEWINTYRVLPL
jgi:hypothetical protein